MDKHKIWIVVIVSVIILGVGILIFSIGGGVSAGKATETHKPEVISKCGYEITTPGRYILERDIQLKNSGTLFDGDYISPGFGARGYCIDIKTHSVFLDCKENSILGPSELLMKTRDGDLDRMRVDNPIGIRIDGQSNIVIENCHFDSRNKDHPLDQGIFIEKSKGGIDIKDNNFKNLDDYGVYWTQGESTAANLIANNFFESVNDAIDITDTGKVTVKDNSFKDNKGTAISVDMKKGEVLENTIYGAKVSLSSVFDSFGRVSSGPVGVSVEGEENLIKNNTIINTVNGIQVGEISTSIAKGNIIEKNLIQKSSKFGIYVSLGETTTVRNNVLESNNEGIVIGDRGNLESNPKKTLVENNKVSESKRNGMRISQEVSGTYKLNSINDGEGSAIFIEESSPNPEGSTVTKIEGNSILRNKGSGVYISKETTNSFQAQISKNIICQNNKANAAEHDDFGCHSKTFKELGKSNNIGALQSCLGDWPKDQFSCVENKCSGGVDEDNDGLADCEDLDCNKDPLCKTKNSAVTIKQSGDFNELRNWFDGERGAYSADDVCRFQLGKSYSCKQIEIYQEGKKAWIDQPAVWPGNVGCKDQIAKYPKPTDTLWASSPYRVVCAQKEICANKVDDDKDGLVDCDDQDCSGACRNLCIDADNDGYGAAGSVHNQCSNRKTKVVNGKEEFIADCNDKNASINPFAKEICDDGVDNDCDGLVDGDDVVFELGKEVSCKIVNARNACVDNDKDGYGARNTDLSKCLDNAKYDCNENNDKVNPGRLEICQDNIDNNCDGNVDESSCVLTCIDDDKDGYGALGTNLAQCLEAKADCNDNPNTQGSKVNPGVAEICDNGVDDDCDGDFDSADSDCKVVCGSVITSDFTMTKDLLNCPGDGLTVGAPDITIDCKDKKISSFAGGGKGINLQYFRNVEIKNCNINNFESGIYEKADPLNFFSTTKNNIHDNTITGGKVGIELVGSIGTTLKDNVITGSQKGVNMVNSVDNIIESNNLCNNIFQDLECINGRDISGSNNMFEKAVQGCLTTQQQPWPGSQLDCSGKAPSQCSFANAAVCSEQECNTNKFHWSGGKCFSQGCGFFSLASCNTKLECEGINRDWYDNKCNSCGKKNLDLCQDKASCENSNVGGNWDGSKCVEKGLPNLCRAKADVFDDPNNKGKIDTKDLSVLKFVVRANGDSKCGGENQNSCQITSKLYVCDDATTSKTQIICKKNTCFIGDVFDEPNKKNVINTKDLSVLRSIVKANSDAKCGGKGQKSCPITSKLHVCDSGILSKTQVNSCP